MDDRLTEIVKRFSGEMLCERKETEGSCDLVFPLDSKEKVEGIFNDIFGPPVKLFGYDPTEYAKRLTKKYGSIRKHQILYVKEYQDDIMIAIAMPWRRGINMTVKIGIVKNSELESRGKIFTAIRDIIAKFFK